MRYWSIDLTENYQNSLNCRCNAIKLEHVLFERSYLKITSAHRLIALVLAQMVNCVLHEENCLNVKRP